jgi:seryl-tRNA(Sec) selenium transferase
MRDPAPARTPRPGDIYRRLGVEPIVNGRSTFTILGGSLMPPEVIEAMRQAAATFVDLIELQEAVGRRLAELTRNEAAFVSGGAAAGLFLAAAASMARRTGDGILRPADLDRYPREFVIHRAHRVPYDTVIELAGGRLVEFGPESGTTPAGRLVASWARCSPRGLRPSSTSRNPTSPATSSHSPPWWKRPATTACR